MTKRPTIPNLVDRKSVKTMAGATLVDHFFWRLRQSGLTYEQFAEKAGISVETLKSWRSGTSPGLHMFADCFAWLGFALVPMQGDVCPDRSSPRFELMGWDWLALEREREELKRVAGETTPTEHQDLENGE
jgi:transcriptional regulator with XRE-family HTH domain